ncbi:MAG: N-acetyl-gamma-glutamyl-phosphate reductase [Deltaproteobacteria bacterium]|nr:N-acetyl-gamma-glutamyl-phosphate reductase [Candidatus Anaeroferrophillacea bacterium]
MAVKKKIRAAIVGASGYTGGELMRLLAGHPRMELTVVTARQAVGRPVVDLFPSLRDCCPLVFREYDPVELAAAADVVFTALPHKAAIEVVAGLAAAGLRVVDLSADFRFSDAAVYEAWYQEHARPDLLDLAVYGLPELFRRRIVAADIVGNPGCYPTAALIGLAPLFREGLVAAGRPVFIDAKSGASGAGRTLAAGSLFCEIDEGLKPYKVGSHRHQPEIVEQLGRYAGVPAEVLFVPHLVPISRGIVSTMYVPLRQDASTEDIAALYGRYYGAEPFVRPLPAGEMPNVLAVRGSNFCDIGFVSAAAGRTLVVATAIDNLVKGAAGQAIQNANLMFGLEETAGLTGLPLYP